MIIRRVRDRYCVLKIVLDNITDCSRMILYVPDNYKKSLIIQVEDDDESRKLKKIQW